MSETPVELRVIPRVILCCPISLAKEGGWKLFTQTVVLSNCGTLVRVPPSETPSVSEMLDIELQIPASASCAGESRTFKCRAKVLRQQDVGQIALRFEEPLELELKQS